MPAIPVAFLQIFPRQKLSGPLTVAVMADVAVQMLLQPFLRISTVFSLRIFLFLHPGMLFFLVFAVLSLYHYLIQPVLRHINV